jgi:hypothetical protein
MKHLIISLSLAAGFMALSTMESSALVCARDVYHAGWAVAVGRPVARTAVIAPRRAVVRRRVY